jgi:hypothetical protein
MDDASESVPPVDLALARSFASFFGLGRPEVERAMVWGA